MIARFPAIPIRFASLIAALPFVLALALLWGSTVTADTVPPVWQDTGLHFSPSLARFCVDATQPTTFITLDDQKNLTGTAAYNWATGEKRVIQSRLYDACSEQTGFLFARNANGTALRFSASDPTGTPIDHYPTSLAKDGSALLYAVSVPIFDAYPALTVKQPSHLWVSDDSGATWTERGMDLGGAITEVAPLDADARMIYALVQAHARDPPRHIVATLYFSADAGATWEQRGSQSVGLSGFQEWPFVNIAAVEGRPAQAMMVQLFTHPGYGGSGAHTDIFLSGDGGNTFTHIGITGLGVYTHLIATTGGIVRLNLGGEPNLSGYGLTRTSDGGATWQTLTLPYQPDSSSASYLNDILAVPGAPGTLIFAGNQRNNPYYTTDSGTTWNQLADYRVGLQVSPSAPMTLLGFSADKTGFSDGELYALDLSSLSLT